MSITPYEHQKEGIVMGLNFKRLIIGDGVGMGKTYQACMIADEAIAYPLLIICPATAKELVWEVKFKEYTGKTAMVLNDSIKNTFPIIYQSGLAHAFIVNYESLSKFFVYEMPKNRKELKLKDILFNSHKDFFKTVIFDEGHRTANPKTIQSKLVYALCHEKEYIMDITGTPVLNRIEDLATQLAIIQQIHHFGGYAEFIHKYSKASKRELELLGEKLRQICYFRREAKDRLDLPEKTREEVIVEIDNAEEYNAALKDLRSYLRDWKNKTDEEIKKSMRGEVMVRIGVLKSISARGKINAVMEFIKDAMELDEKIIVFGHHTDVLKSIKDKLPNAVTVIGADSSMQRKINVDRFQNDKNVNPIICSLKAASECITLTKGRIVMFVEMGWNPASMEQSEGRAHRITQERNVHCIYFLGKNTIDNWVYQIIENKQRLSNAITGSADGDIEWSVIESVIDLILTNEN